MERVTSISSRRKVHSNMGGTNNNRNSQSNSPPPSPPKRTQTAPHKPVQARVKRAKQYATNWAVKPPAKKRQIDLNSDEEEEEEEEEHNSPDVNKKGHPTRGGKAPLNDLHKQLGGDRFHRRKQNKPRRRKAGVGMFNVLCNE